MICREWDRKARPWSLGNGLVRIFMEANTKMDLACIAKPYMDVVWKVWLLGINPRSIIFSPFFLLFLLFPGPLLFFSSLFPFILVFTSPSSSTCQFLLIWGNYSSYQSIRQSGWEKLDSMVWSMEYGLVRLWVPHYGVGSFLVCTALVLSLSFSSGALWGVECEIVLGHVLGPSGSCIARPRRLGFIGQGFGPLTQNGRGPQISGPTVAFFNIFKIDVSRPPLPKPKKKKNTSKLVINVLISLNVT